MVYLLGLEKCLWVASVSPWLFAFEWENPHIGNKEQLTRMRHPQGFKYSPTLFSRALASDLAKFPRQELDYVLFQYIGDILLDSTMQVQCLEGTKTLLSLIMEAGHQVPKKKAQICKRQVRYLGFNIMQGRWMLGNERKQAVYTILTPTTRQRSMSSWEQQDSVRHGSLDFHTFPGTYIRNKKSLPLNGDQAKRWHFK